MFSQLYIYILVTSLTLIFWRQFPCVVSESRSVMSDSLQPRGLYSSWNFPGQNTGVGSHCLLQGIFLTQRSNQRLLHCRWVLYQLSYQGSLCYAIIVLLRLRLLIGHTYIFYGTMFLKYIA